MSAKDQEAQTTEDLLSGLLGPAFMATGKGAATDPMDQPEASQDGEDVTAEDEGPLVAAEPMRPRRRRTRPQAAPRSARRATGRLLGLLLLGLGLLGAGLEAAGMRPTTLPPVADGALLALGAVVFVVSLVRAQERKAEEWRLLLDEERGDMQAMVQHLLDQQDLEAQRPPAEGEELARVLQSLERLDEKVANVSRALKMYGKPLIEIATQSADNGGNIAQIQQAAAAMQQSLARLGEATPGAVDFGPLQQQLMRIEAAVTAAAQRQDDAEMRKSLVRLEDSSKAWSKKLEELAHQDAVQQEVQRLEKVVDVTIGKLTSTVDQVRDKDLGGLESTVREIQREVAGLATSVAYIQQAVRTGGAKAPAPAAAMTPAAAPAAAPASEGAFVPAMPAAVGAKPPEPAPGATEDAQAGVQENRTGARATSGKNVLGAIAKLRQMKT